MNIYSTNILGSSPDHEESAAVRRIDRALLPTSLDSMTSRDLDEMERAASSIQLLVRKELMHRAGVRLVHDWRGAPHVDQYGMARESFSWMDHLRTVMRGRRKSHMMAFPYQIDSDGILDLAELIRSDKWDVSIWGCQDVYYPGDTVPVVIRKKTKDKSAVGSFGLNIYAPHKEAKA